MSNRFKFRVWLPDENRYLHNTDCPVVDSDGNLMWCYLNPFGHWEHHKMEDAVIEQCTGLTDKNGKLIFEGDVLLFNGSRNPVYFDDGSFVILHSGSVFIPIKQKYTDVFEIIGNIHEMEEKNERRKVYASTVANIR